MKFSGEVLNKVGWWTLINILRMLRYASLLRTQPEMLHRSQSSILSPGWDERGSDWILARRFYRLPRNVLPQFDRSNCFPWGHFLFKITSPSCKGSFQLTALMYAGDGRAFSQFKLVHQLLPFLDPGALVTMTRVTSLPISIIQSLYRELGQS